MHVGMRVHPDLSQICRLHAHVWPYITSALPLQLSSCCGPTSLLEAAKPPCEPASLLPLTFPFSFSCYIEHKSGISSLLLNLSISLHRNLFVGTNDSIHSLEWVAGYGCLRPECGPVDHWGKGGGCQKDNIPENRWDYMAQPIKLTHKQVGTQPTSQDGLWFDFPKEFFFFSLNFKKPTIDVDLFWWDSKHMHMFHNCCICCFNKRSTIYCYTTNETHTYLQLILLILKEAWSYSTRKKC